MKPRLNIAPAVWPNAGVEAWYREKLQLIVTAMADDMRDSIKRIWREAPPMSMDAMPRYAAGVMFRFQHLVLLLHRTDGLGWAWPGGGVEPGETFSEAVVRECVEEMGEIVPTPFSFGDHEVIDVQNEFGVGYVTYECPLASTFTPTLNFEHDAYMWVSPSVALQTLNLHSGVRSTLTEFVDAHFGPVVAQDGAHVSYANHVLYSTSDPPALFEPRLAQDAVKAMRAKPPSQSVLLQRAMNKWGTTWTKRLQVMSQTIARDFATKNRAATERSMKASFAKAGWTVKFKPNKAVTAAFDAVVGENVGLIKSIPERYLTDVQAQVWRSVMDGSDMKTLSEGLHEKYGIAWRRASLIAMDQNNKGKAAIERARRLEVGITQARWLHSHAGVEPRPSHEKAGRDRVVYDVAKGWWDPHEQKYIWPGTLVRCRCADMAVVPGFP